MRIYFYINVKKCLELRDLLELIRNYFLLSDFYFIYKFKNDYLLPYSYTIIKYDDRHNFKRFLVNFSSIDNRIVVYLYNYMLKLSKKSDKIKISFLDIKRKIRFKNNFCTFKTLSPILLNINDSNWYLNEDINLIYTNLEKIIDEISLYYLDKKTSNLEIKFKKLYKIAVKIDDKILQGFEGIFQIKSDPSLLEIISDIGLGYKKDYGFGKIELIDSKGERDE